MLSNDEKALLREYIAQSTNEITETFLSDIASSDTVAREKITTYKEKRLAEFIDAKTKAEAEIARLNSITIGE